MCSSFIVFSVRVIVWFCFCYEILRELLHASNRFNSTLWCNTLCSSGEFAGDPCAVFLCYVLLAGSSERSFSPMKGRPLFCALLTKSKDFLSTLETSKYAIYCFKDPSNLFRCLHHHHRCRHQHYHRCQQHHRCRHRHQPSSSSSSSSTSSASSLQEYTYRVEG